MKTLHSLLNAAAIAAVACMSAQLVSTHAQQAKPEKFRLSRSTVDVPERGGVTVFTLDTTYEKFSFIPPAECDVRLDAAARKIVFDSRKGVGLFTLQLSTNQVLRLDGDTPPSKEEVCSRWPGSKVAEEFDQPTGIGQGRAFVLKSLVAKRDLWLTRVVVVPTRAGPVELTLSSPATEAAKHQHGFANLMNTLKVEPHVVATR